MALIWTGVTTGSPGSRPGSLAAIQCGTLQHQIGKQQRGFASDVQRKIGGPIAIIVALPAKCPELNPVENIWQFMLDNWLSNRVFTSYDNIVDHCCEA